MRNETLLWPLALAALLGFACGPLPGDPFDAEDGKGPAHATGETDPELVSIALEVKAGAPMMRNLSNREYLGAVASLIGAPLEPELQRAWTATTQYGGFDAVPWTNFDTKAMRDRAETLETILDRAVASPKVMTPCEGARAGVAPYAECAALVLEPFAKRAFGRPLSEEERASLEGRYVAGVELARTLLSDNAAIHRDGIRAALGSVLLAPQFLTRVESPPSPDFTGERELTAYELANRIAFMFLGSLPDDELWARAEDGTLTKASVIAAQVERFLDTRTDVFVHNFMGQWFDFRAYEGAAERSLERSMWLESLQVFADVVRDDLPVASLVKPGFTYVDAPLAQHYGLAAPGGGAQRIVTNARGGVLQQGAWLSLSASPMKTSPMHRGRLVQDRLLCKTIAPPDSALFEEIQAVSARIPADATVKQRLSAHRDAGPACKSCHQYMDPIGLGLEGFDPTGKARTVYPDGKPVETDSEILGRPFRTAEELNDILVTLPEYTQCVSEKLSIYAMRTSTPDPELVRYLVHAPKTEKAPGMRAMILRMVKSNAFRKVNHGARS